MSGFRQRQCLTALFVISNIFDVYSFKHKLWIDSFILHLKVNMIYISHRHATCMTSLFMQQMPLSCAQCLFKVKVLTKWGLVQEAYLYMLINTYQVIDTVIKKFFSLSCHWKYIFVCTVHLSGIELLAVLCCPLVKHLMNFPSTSLWMGMKWDLF